MIINPKMQNINVEGQVVLAENLKDARENSLAALRSVNAVAGFDPMSVSYYVSTEEGRFRLCTPIRVQIMWLRKVYPDAKIRTKVRVETIANSDGSSRNVYVAHAWIYASRTDPESAYLSEGEVERPTEDLSSSIRETTATLAIGIALRNAGFIAVDENIIGGDSVMDNESTAQKEDAKAIVTPSGMPDNSAFSITEGKGTLIEKQPKNAVSRGDADRLLDAQRMPFPFSSHNGKTMGEVMAIDRKAIEYVLRRGSAEQQAAAAILLNATDSTSK